LQDLAEFCRAGRSNYFPVKPGGSKQKNTDKHIKTPIKLSPAPAVPLIYGQSAQIGWAPWAPAVLPKQKNTVKHNKTRITEFHPDPPGSRRRDENKPEKWIAFLRLTVDFDRNMNTPLTRRDFIVTAGAATMAAATLPVLAQDDKKLTIAFVGVAHIHTPGYVSLVHKRSDVRVKYVWDHDAERAARRAKDAGAEAVANVETIWSDKEIAAVIILSETDRHHDLVLAATKAGKHLFVEKPLGITSRDSLEMAAAIEKAGLLFTTGYFSRTDPHHLFLKQEVAAGNFGQITRVRASNCHNGSLKGWFDQEFRWMADPKISGCGAFGDLGTHKLDILMWLLGDVASVTAAVRPVTHRYGDCDETGEALMQFKSGIIGTLAAGWVDIEDPVKLLISGTQGHAVIFNNQLFYRSEKVAGSDSRKPVTGLPPAPKAPMDQFLDAVAGSHDEPLVTPREAAARVAVMQSMYEAARRQTWVQIT
jgi:predicted dehydrogenase